MRVAIIVVLVSIIATVQSASTYYSDKLVIECQKKYSLTDTEVCDLKNANLSLSPKKSHQQFVWCMMSGYGWLVKKGKNTIFSQEIFDKKMSGVIPENNLEAVAEICEPPPASFTYKESYDLYGCYFGAGLSSIILSQYVCKSAIKPAQVIKDCIAESKITNKSLCDLKNRKFYAKPATASQNFIFCVVRGYGWVDNEYGKFIFSNGKFYQSMKKLKVTVNRSVVDSCSPPAPPFTSALAYGMYSCVGKLNAGSFPLGSIKC